MKTLSLLLLLAVQGGIAQNKPQYSVDLSAPHASKKIAMSINLSDTQQNHYYSVNFGVEVPGKITSEVEVSVDGRRIFTREQTQARLEWVADGFTRDIAELCTLEIIQAVEFGTKDKSLNYVKDACAKPSNVSSDKWQLAKESFDKFCGEADVQPPICTVKWPEAQPLVEKAVEKWWPYKTMLPKDIPNGSYATVKGGEMYWYKATCTPHPGFHVFLLPDESTGEKYCLNIPKEKQ